MCLYFLTGHEVHQVMGLCEQNDNKLGQIISKSAYGGQTFNELRFFDGKFTYQLFSNYTQPEIKPDLELSKLRLVQLYYPACIQTLKNYLKKRETQLNRKGIMQSTINRHNVFIYLKVIFHFFFFSALLSFCSETTSQTHPESKLRFWRVSCELFGNRILPSSHQPDPVQRRAACSWSRDHWRRSAAQWWRDVPDEEESGDQCCRQTQIHLLCHTPQSGQHSGHWFR